MIFAYVGIGSNIDRHKHIEAAIDALRKVDPTLRLSSIYESSAIGFTGNPFFNLVVEIKSSLTLEAFSEQLRSIEFQLGRPKNAKKLQDRTIDLDLVLFGDHVNHQSPTIPREDIYKYPFVIQPLYELCPELIIPKDGRSVRQIWQLADSKETLTKVEPWFGINNKSEEEKWI